MLRFSAARMSDRARIRPPRRQCLANRVADFRRLAFERVAQAPHLAAQAARARWLGACARDFAGTFEQRS